MSKISITRRLLILFFIVGASCLSVIGTYSYYNAKRALLKRTLDQLTSIRVIKKWQIEFLFSERGKNLFFLANSNYVINLIEKLQGKGTSQPSDKPEPDNILSSVSEQLSYQRYGFSNMFIVTRNTSGNTFIFSIQDNCLSQVTLNPKLKEILLNHWNNSLHSDSVNIMDFAKTSSAKEPVCLISKRVLDHSGKFIGLLALQIPSKAINEIMLEDSNENGLGESGEVYLVGPDYLMRSNSRFIKNSFLKTVVNTVSVNNAFKSRVGSSLIDDYRAVACLSSFDRVSVKGLNWVIVAEIDYEEAMIPIVSIRNDILFLSLLICILLFSVAHFISKGITQPIIRLKNAALKIGEGKFENNLPASSGDEIGLLTDAFNTMSVQLQEEKSKRMSALYDGQELERQRISRDLHDDLGQKLVAIKLMLESTSKQNSEATRQTIEEVKIDFLKLIEEVREISGNFAPNVLNESGIDVALKNLCSSVGRSAGIHVDFSSYGDFVSIDRKINTYIFRIAQEGLNNAVKHSHAENIHVQLLRNKENLILIVEDNGTGFVFDDNFVNNGNGLYNMKERALLINGSMNIETSPNEGTTIRLKIPLKQ